MSTYYIKGTSGSDKLESSIDVYDYAGGTYFGSVLKYGLAMGYDKYVVNGYSGDDGLVATLLGQENSNTIYDLRGDEGDDSFTIPGIKDFPYTNVEIRDRYDRK